MSHSSGASLFRGGVLIVVPNGVMIVKCVGGKAGGDAMRYVSYLFAV